MVGPAAACRGQRSTQAATSDDSRATTSSGRARLHSLVRHELQVPRDGAVAEQDDLPGRGQGVGRPLLEDRLLLGALQRGIGVE